MGLSLWFAKAFGSGQRRAVSEPIKEVIEGLCLQKPPLPIATLYRQIVKLARDRGEQAPSYGTVFNIVRSLPADLVTLAHEGTKNIQQHVRAGSPARSGTSKLDLAG